MLNALQLQILRIKYLRAEQADLPPAEKRVAYMELSGAEQNITSKLPGTDDEGAIARRGAVRAAIQADRCWNWALDHGLVARDNANVALQGEGLATARLLVSDYLADRTLPDSLALQLIEMLQDALFERVKAAKNAPTDG